LVATTESAVIKACRHYRFRVAVIGHEKNPETKRRILALVRRYCPSAKVLEVYPVEVGKTLKRADAWLPLPKQDPTDLVSRVTALANSRVITSTQPTSAQRPHS
jgi:hypothetical protein